MNRIAIRRAGAEAGSAGAPVIPTIETERLVLRGYALADFDAFADLWDEAEVTRFITSETQTRRDSWHRFLRNAGHWVMLGYGYWAVVEKATDRFVGMAGFLDGKRDLGPDFDKTPEAGWVFSPASKGRGLATEAVRAAHRWIDGQAFGGRTVCIMDPEHSASFRVATKCGYKELRVAKDTHGPVLLMARG